MKRFYNLPACLYISICLLLFCSTLSAQVIKPYSLIYTDNIKGSSTIFGNTIMHIVDNSNPNTTKMNESGNAANGQGGLGYSQYGNDGENMQYTDVDANIVTPLINTGDNWNYSTASSQPASWPNVTLAGGPGPSPLGYGPTGSVGTSLTDFRTYYFTKAVNITTANFNNYTLTLKLDDGAVVYVNGTEIARVNMPGGTPSYTTDASSNIEPEATTTLTIPAGAPFVNGSNTIQVEVHTSANNESGTDDLFFDLNLTGNYTTANSSSADFTLPAGTNTIKFARLYWGGRIDNSVITAAPDTLRKVKIRKGSGAYSTVFTAAANVDTYAPTSSDKVYQSFVDITSFFHTSGTQTYTVADIPLTTGSITGGGHFGGWSIVVAYENATLPYKSVRIYDGYAQVGSSATQSITLNGLDVPNNALTNADALFSTMAWEGDANLFGTAGNPAGDFLKINGNTFSNAMNPASNMWNGSITKNGANVSTKNPNYSNQMGIDIDEADIGVGYGITPGATSVTILFGTEQDQYFPSLLNFSITMKEPTIVLDKTVLALSGSTILVTPNELLTYTISGINNGPGAAYNSVITDTLPTNVVYSAGTLQIVTSPGIPSGIQTDANDGDYAFKGTNGGKNYVKFFIGTGATSSTGGIIAANETYIVKFKVNATANPGLIVNTARINAASSVGVPYVDDGTATIGFAGGPQPVKMTYFNGSLQPNGSVLLKWETSSEINSDKFEIERSEDGVSFTKRGTVKATGTTTQRQQYQFTDVLNTASKIFYYRLKTIDFGGKYDNSKTIAIRLSGSKIENYIVYPNPFVSDIKMSVSSDKVEDVTFRIITIDGKIAVARNVTIEKGENIVVLKDLGQLQKGSYILEMVTPTSKVAKKILKD